MRNVALLLLFSFLLSACGAVTITKPLSDNGIPEHIPRYWQVMSKGQRSDAYLVLGDYNNAYFYMPSSNFFKDNGEKVKDLQYFRSVQDVIDFRADYYLNQIRCVEKNDNYGLCSFRMDSGNIDDGKKNYEVLRYKILGNRLYLRFPNYDDIMKINSQGDYPEIQVFETPERLLHKQSIVIEGDPNRVINIIYSATVDDVEGKEDSPFVAIDEETLLAYFNAWLLRQKTEMIAVLQQPQAPPPAPPVTTVQVQKTEEVDTQKIFDNFVKGIQAAKNVKDLFSNSVEPNSHEG